MRLLPDSVPEPATRAGHGTQPAQTPLVNKALRRPPMTVTAMRDSPGFQNSSARRQASELMDDSRAGARKAVPITRGQELGLRFRPDERDPIGGQAYPGQPGQGAAGHFTPSDNSQFRPLPKAKRRTYEDMQAESQAVAPPMAPAMPYPMLPMPPVGPGYWR
jgi:hypothetical protein